MISMRRDQSAGPPLDTSTRLFIVFTLSPLVEVCQGEFEKIQVY